MAGAEWKKLSKEQQAPYQQKFEAARKKYNEDMAAFLAAGGVKQKVKPKPRAAPAAKAQTAKAPAAKRQAKLKPPAAPAAKARAAKPPAHNLRGQRRLNALDAKYPWGQKDGPPPANEAEQRSLAEQMARLRIEAGNFARPERADNERLARADAMLDIMRGKARAGFGGGLALATRGFRLNRTCGLELAKRAKKLALEIEAHFDPVSAPSVMIEEGLALWDASAD